MIDKERKELTFKRNGITITFFCRLRWQGSTLMDEAEYLATMHFRNGAYSTIYLAGSVWESSYPGGENIQDVQDRQSAVSLANTVWSEAVRDRVLEYGLAEGLESEIRNMGEALRKANEHKDRAEYLHRFTNLYHEPEREDYDE